MALRRIRKDIEEIKTASIFPYLTIIDSDAAIFQYIITFHGPNSSPYENIKLALKLQFPNDYPFRPPKVLFVNQICHSNITSNGDFPGLPMIIVYKILEAIRDILITPDFVDDIGNFDACNIGRKDLKKYEQYCRENTKAYVE
eukprot:Pgem_evm1s9864